MPKRRGFTLVELLVVVSILALLLTLLLPTIKRAKEIANRTACMNTMRSVGLAALHYANDHHGCPPNQDADEDTPPWGWQVAPYWGLSSDPAIAPRKVQPWYGNNACPSWRPKHPYAVHPGSGHYGQVAFVLNYNMLGTSGGRNIYTIRNPDQVYWITESHFCTGTMNSLVYPRDTCIGMTASNGYPLIYPRHWGEGINWGFLDGSVCWLDYSWDLGCFVPVQPLRN